MGKWIESKICDVCADCGENINQGEEVYVLDGESYCCEGCGEEAEAWDMDAEDDLIDGIGFADPGGNSALRAETPDNPRNLPCPSCGKENRLTPLDVAAHYQCDVCADECEGGY